MGTSRSARTRVLAGASEAGTKPGLAKDQAAELSGASNWIGRLRSILFNGRRDRRAGLVIIEFGIVADYFAARAQAQETSRNRVRVGTDVHHLRAWSATLWRQAEQPPSSDSGSGIGLGHVSVRAPIPRVGTSVSAAFSASMGCPASIPSTPRAFDRVATLGEGRSSTPCASVPPGTAPTASPSPTVPARSRRAITRSRDKRAGCLLSARCGGARGSTPNT